MIGDESTGSIEHPSPTCPNCGGQKTRPLDDKWATCFDCGYDWMMIEEVRRSISADIDQEGDSEDE